MMRRVLVVCLVVALLTMGAEAAQRLATVKGRQIIGADSRPILLRGISLGNWLLPEGYMFHFEKAVSPRLIEDAFTELVGPDQMRQFWRTWRQRYVTRADVQLLKRLGFNSLRVPFSYKVLTPEEYPEVWLDEGFTCLDKVIAWAREADMLVILDMHAAPGGQTGDNIDDSWGHPWLYESEENQARTVAIWQRLARRYRDNPTVLGYELLNEPIAHFTDKNRFNPMLEPLYRRITSAIRVEDPDHLIFLGGAQWNTNFAVFGAPFDAKAVYTFHRYWASNDEAGIADFLRFREKYEVPLWMGESGENTDAWIGGFRATLEKADVGWAFWPYKKMDATSCVASFERPPHWAEIVRYADTMRGGTFEEKRKARPGVAVAREALYALLRNIELDRCRVNKGFVEALGLKVP